MTNHDPTQLDGHKRNAMGNNLAMRTATILFLASLCVSWASQTQADIFQWAYVNSDPTQGVYQSFEVCPGGSGVSAVPGVRLSNLDLTKAYLIGANLTDSYLSSVMLGNANLTNANLTNAQLYSDAISADLTNANLTGATIIGSQFFGSNLTASQLYSTGSYQWGILMGIGLSNINLTGGDFHNQLLSNITLSNVNLSKATLSHANLTNAVVLNTNLSDADLTNANLTTNAAAFIANLTGADLRGAKGMFVGPYWSVTTTNAILPDGTVQGLHLDSTNPSLLVRNYSNNLPIHIRQGMSLDSGTSLVLQINDATWGSTIAFDSGISVLLGGNLELGVASGVDPVGLRGDTFRLFDWTGVSYSGQFQIVNDLPAGYSWDTSQLYTTGNVTLLPTPEPSTLGLLAAGSIGLLGFKWRRRQRKTISHQDETEAPAILSFPTRSIESKRMAA